MTPLVLSYLYMQVSGGVVEASEYVPGGLFIQLHKTYLLTTCMTPLVSSYLYMQVSGGVAEASEYGLGGLFTQLH